MCQVYVWVLDNSYKVVFPFIDIIFEMELIDTFDMGGVYASLYEHPKAHVISEY